MSEATPRQWWIQKPIAHNCPLEKNGAVFETSEPSWREKNCEWLKVIDMAVYDVLQAKCAEYERALEFYEDPFKIMNYIDGTYSIDESWEVPARKALAKYREVK